MKSTFFALIITSLFASVLSAAPLSTGGDPTDVKVVVSGKKIWFVADEMPVKCLCVKVKDNAGKVVLEKCLSSKTADWSLNVENLPRGKYTVEYGKDKSVAFDK
jgi:hypothetical protein